MSGASNPGSGLAVSPAFAVLRDLDASPEFATLPGLDATTPRSGVGSPVPALEVYGIVKKWRGRGVVLDGVDLVVERGEAVHISGRNGCGKTTLLRIAVGLIKPNSGVVSALGLHPDLDRREYHLRVGYLAAGDRALYARITVRGHLRFWARLSCVPPEIENEAIERALDRFDLRELANARADRLSMGQRQRVRVAGAFLTNPEVVLLDEPRNSLDDEGIALLRTWLGDVIARNGAVIWCSPNGEATDFDFDTELTINAGRLQPR
jgi:ABC-type multidrug transport system ATPase subunit